ERYSRQSPVYRVTLDQPNAIEIHALSGSLTVQWHEFSGQGNWSKEIEGYLKDNFERVDKFTEEDWMNIASANRLITVNLYRIEFEEFAFALKALESIRGL